MTDILAKLARWAQQNPQAVAGDHAGEELLNLVRSISATPAPISKGVRCQTCHRIIPKDVALKDFGDSSAPGEVAGGGEAVTWEDIAETLCGTDGNGFFCDIDSATKRNAYEIRARDLLAAFNISFRDATLSPGGGAVEALRLLKKISDLADDEDVGEPLDDAIGYANKAIAALSALPPAQTNEADPHGRT